tara:strand:+ start:108 stop:500 length:393 start_codon:yes stop_codon:yes gene_type:complete
LRNIQDRGVAGGLPGPLVGGLAGGLADGGLCDTFPLVSVVLSGVFFGAGANAPCFPIKPFKVLTPADKSSIIICCCIFLSRSLSAGVLAAFNFRLIKSGPCCFGGGRDIILYLYIIKFNLLNKFVYILYK